jgi:hypothetical protein
MGDSIQQDVTAKVFSYLKQTSQAVLQAYSNVNNINITEHSSALRVMGHWMSIILVSGTAFRMTFKTHYKTYRVQGFLGPGLAPDRAAQFVHHSQADDFMREFCNLVAGQVKKLGLHNGMEMGISLPITMRGFDEVFAEASSTGDDHHFTAWKLRSEEAEVICSATLDFTDVQSLAGTEFQADLAALPGDSEVDFL